MAHRYARAGRADEEGVHTEKTEKQNILFTRIAQIAQRVSQWM